MKRQNRSLRCDPIHESNMAKWTHSMLSAILFAFAVPALAFCPSHIGIGCRPLAKSTVHATPGDRANAVGWSLHHTDLGHGKVPQLSSRCNQRRRLELFAAMEVIEPSYNLAVGATVLGTAFGVYDLRTPRPTIHSIPGLIFGLLLLYQTSLHRFVIDDSSFSLMSKQHLFASGENNLVSDSSRRWEFNHFANYDFFPSREFPILVYVKETQTPSHKWNDGPGKAANSDEALARGARPGAVHFFPAFGDVAQMEAAFHQHKCQKLFHNKI